MNIFVVIPNWNGADMLSHCLESLQKQTQLHKIIVVDNGSVDNSIEIVKKFKNIILIQNSKNYGFTGGVNPGIEYAIKYNADYVVLFNNDAIAKKDWLKNLIKAMNSHPEAGIVTSKIMRDDKKHLDSTGDFYSVYGTPFPRGRNLIDSGQYDNDTEVFGASGGASMYKVSMLKEIGIFDQRFFAYYEDVDISFRARLAGWKIFYEPSAIVYHKVSSTSSKMGDFSRYHSIKNFLILYTKDMPLKLYLKYLPKFLYQYLRSLARSIIDKKIHVFIKASAVFLINLPSILIDRHKIQKNRKISVKEIDSFLVKTKPEKIPEI